MKSVSRQLCSYLQQRFLSAEPLHRYNYVHPDWNLMQVNLGWGTEIMLCHTFREACPARNLEYELEREIAHKS